jgi:outer membrane protein
LSGSATRYEQPYALFPIHGFNPSSIPPFNETIYSGALTLSYTLFDGWARPARVRQARSRLSAARESLHGTEQALLARVLSTYLDVLSRARVLDAQDRRIDAIEAERARVQRFLDVGRAARLDFLRVEAGLAAARADRVRLAAALDLAERDLARLIGATPAETRAGHLAAIGVADTTLAARAVLLERARRASPSVAQARLHEDAARAGGRGARGMRWPEVKLVGNYLGWADPEGDDTTEWSAAAQVSLPIFSGGAVDHGIRKADAIARGASEQRRLVETQVEQDLDRALNAILEARARVSSLAAAEESTAEVARIERLALDGGSGTQTDYLDSEASLFAARAGLIEARHREIAARAELARVTGTLDLAWFEQNLEEER